LKYYKTCLKNISWAKKTPKIFQFYDILYFSK